MTERIQATRMDGTISIAVPTTDDAAERYYYTDPSPNNAGALVSPDLLEASREAVGGDTEVRGVDASVGRGAMRSAQQVGREILAALEAMRPFLDQVPGQARLSADLTGLGDAFGATDPTAGASG